MDEFQLILNPIRDWNDNSIDDIIAGVLFQLILNPIRDWNHFAAFLQYNNQGSN